MSIEARPGYLYDRTKREMRAVRLDKYGDEVCGFTISEHSDREEPLVDYDFRNPINYPEGGSNLDDTAGDLVGVETDDGDDLTANFDVRKPPKYPSANSSMDSRPASLSRN